MSDELVDEFRRLPVGVRIHLMDQVRAVTGLSQPEKAHLVRQVGAAKRVIVPTLDPETTVVFARLLDAVGGLVLQGFHAAAGRDTYAEVTTNPRKET